MTLREAADRYGAAAVIVLALAMLVILMPSNVDKDSAVDTASETALRAGQGGESAGSDVLGDSASGLEGDIGGSGGTVGGTTPAGGVRGGTGTLTGGAGFEFGKGPNCRADGRQYAIARSSPPCVNWTGKDNGGATYPGVARDKVKIVRIVHQSDPATEAILESAALADDPEVVKNAFLALFKYYNQHLQTYGREVYFEDYNARGPSTNDEQMQADAVDIATTRKPFLVWNGTKVQATELAARGINCVCTVTLSSQYYQSLPPYIWGSLPTSTEYAQHLGEYVGKKLAGKNAKFAGDELNPTQNFKTKKRVFGLIYLEGAAGRADPEGKRAKDSMVAEAQKNGWDFKRTIAYTYDPGRNQQDLTTMIAAMRGDGVTTVLMFVDPLYPILITNEATRQQYYPEWIVTGTGLSDTTAAARLYDQQQWRHAFGISPLWVGWATVQKSYGWRETHHGNPSMPDGEEGVLINIYASVPRIIFTGIHMAGPKLTAQTFANGLFSYPRSGGTPAIPTTFFTREYPTAIKDFIEIYYDPNVSGPDERGLEGNGMYMKVDIGKRHELGQWEREDTRVFTPQANAASVSDDPRMGGDPDHEQDGHKHSGKCLSCT